MLRQHVPQVKKLIYPYLMRALYSSASKAVCSAPLPRGSALFRPAGHPASTSHPRTRFIPSAMSTATQIQELGVPNLPTSFKRLVAEKAGTSFRDAVQVQTAPIDTVLPGQGEVSCGSDVCARQ